MSSFRPAPGVGLIVLGVLAVSAVMTLALGMYAHWPIIALSIVVGLWAVRAINS